MNLEEILEQVQVQLGNGADPIDWEDDEIVAQIRMANLAILNWAVANNTAWRELQVDKTLGEVEAGENTWKVPANVRKIEKVYLGNGAIRAQKPYSVLQAQNAKGGFYLEGNAKKGRKLKLIQEIAQDNPIIGEEVAIVGVKSPDLLKNPEDMPELADPTYIVDYICAMVSTDDDLNKYSIFSTNYAQKLDAMIAENNQDQEDNYLNDSDWMIGE